MRRIREALTLHREAIILTLGVNLVLFSLLTLTFLGIYLFEREVFQKIITGDLREAQGASLLGYGSTQLESSHIVNIVDYASPAVVSIIVSKRVPIMEQYYGIPELWEDIFGPELAVPIPQFREKEVQEQQVGGGSGFIISADGLVMTNRHVVEDMQARYTILTSEGTTYDAEIVARDPSVDLALLRIDSDRTFPYIEFGDSDALKPGQTVIAIGNALGEFRNSVSVGVVSGLSRSVVAGDALGNVEHLDEVIQTDAAINAGNSGGPLLDLGGRVVGINVAVALGSENIGFALPANLARTVADSVERYGTIVRPYLGVRYVRINEQVKTANSLTVNYGALVSAGEGSTEAAIVQGSPAERAGLQEHDVILSVNGIDLKDKTLQSVIRMMDVGQTITLEVVREGQLRHVEVTLEQAPN